MGRILALDPGTKRIGLAVSDPSAVVAQGLEPVARGRGQQWAEEIDRLVRAYQLSEIVVGLPRNMDGSEGPAAADARGMVEILRARLTIPVKLWDERLTTVAAQRMFREAGVKAQQSKKRLDGVAAVLILQGYLDHRAQGGKDHDPR